MKRNLISLFVICLIVVSCKDDEKIDLPEITKISFVDYPDIAFTLVTDSIPDTFVNTTDLPAEAGKTAPIQLSIEASNFHSIEVYEAGSQSIKTFDSETFSLEYRPLYFIKINSPGGLSRIYALRMIRDSLGDPQIISLDFQLDPTGLSPLAGVIKVTSDQAVKLSYTVKGQDGEDFTSATGEYKTDPEINLFGLYAGYTNRVLIEIVNEEGNRSAEEVFVKTQDLPATLPQPNEIKVNKADLANSTSQFVMFFPLRTTGVFTDEPILEYYPIGVDRFGKIRWYLKVRLDASTIMKKLNNGHWMHSLEGSFRELDLLGNIYSEIQLEHHSHHDFIEMPNGDILYLADNTTPHNTVEDVIYRIDRSGVIKDVIDLYPMLDPSRPQLPTSLDTRDWFHANSLFYEPSDNSILVSGRHQSAVIKVDLETKELKWIFSDPTNWNEDLQPFLLTPTGENFSHHYGQHSAILNPNDPSRLILFDNGNGRSYSDPLPPADSYTRLVEYKITGTSVQQTFEFGQQYGSELFAPYVGNVGFVGSTGYFICFGAIFKDDAGNPIDLLDAEMHLQAGRNNVRFMEINNSGEVYLDLAIETANTGPGKGIRSYRAYPFNFN